MIDIHSHLIYGVDDGPSTIDESLRMVEAAAKQDVKVIIATPHFQENIFENDKLVDNFYELVYKTSDYGVDLKMGYEVFINPFIPDILKGKKSLTLNESRYMLLEMPFDDIPIYSYETIYKLQLERIIPIIAHPERNRTFLKNFDTFTSFIERGCLVQLDAASIVGVYGKSVKNFAKKLIKSNMAQFVASDAHFARDYTNWYKKAYQKVRKWAGEEYADKLFYRNSKFILDNIEESIFEMI
ncbi:MAG: phosphoesterase [Clostridia bacterium]|nr:phosphoesterase [Clostridia bacterium]